MGKNGKLKKKKFKLIIMICIKNESKKQKKKKRLDLSLIGSKDPWGFRSKDPWGLIPIGFEWVSMSCVGFRSTLISLSLLGLDLNKIKPYPCLLLNM